MEGESTLFSDWLNDLTITGFANMMLLISFTLLIIWMVARTFRGKADV